LAELFECDREVLNDRTVIKRSMEHAATESGATVIDTIIHTFSPHGISGVVVIAESHLAVHTWPEYGYAAVDVFTCGDTIDPWGILEALKGSLVAREMKTVELHRGVIRSKGVLRHKPIPEETD
jgi:S-adenosylmethionine decarboxylase proenzyme